MIYKVKTLSSTTKAGATVPTGTEIVQKVSVSNLVYTDSKGKRIEIKVPGVKLISTPNEIYIRIPAIGPGQKTWGRIEGFNRKFQYPIRREN